MLTIPRAIFIITFVVLMITTYESSNFYNKTADQYLTTLTESTDEAVGVDLSVIEFDDFGVMWDRQQLNDTLSLIKRRNEESDSGILLITYTHGWKNNANPDDADGELAKFRKRMITLSKQLGNSKDSNTDHIVAVFLGWRGVSSKLPGLDNLTFWGRKRAAHRIASHQMRETLISLSKITKEYPNSKVQFTGHSMGGMILAQTMAPSLTTELMLNDSEGHQYIADLIVLKNPALDGLSTSLVIDYLKDNDVKAELRFPDGRIEPATGPAIVSITSESDWITSIGYPLGQFLGNFMTSTDFRTDSEVGMPTQKELATNSMGNLAHLVSHRAWVEDGKLMLDRASYSYNDTPFWVIQVSDEISSGHSDVDNDRFNELITKLNELNRLYDTNAQTWLRKTDYQ